MKHVLLPSDDTRRRAPFYLAMEEWVAANMPGEDYVFTWIVGPTVVCGRNQDIDNEVDLEYCRANGIDVVRRRSGGGCIFADRRNIMISFVTPSQQVQETFADYTCRVARQLCRMGMNAEATGRNDIVVDGRKISGNAFYHVRGHSIVHGTMLYDTDPVHISRAITPSRVKLQSKGVKSVRSRIVTAHELFPDMTIAEFHNRLVDGLADEIVTLTDDQLDEIREIEQRYYADSWLYRSRRGAGADKPVCTGSAAMYVDGAGSFAVTVSLGADGCIDRVALTGDFFTTTAAPDERLPQRLHGVRPDMAAVTAALVSAGFADAVPQLDVSLLADLILRAAADAA